MVSYNMLEIPNVSVVVINYINAREMFEFKPEMYHSLIDDLAFDSLDVIDLSIRHEKSQEFPQHCISIIRVRLRLEF